MATACDQGEGGPVLKLLEKAKTKAPARSLVSIEDIGAATARLAYDVAQRRTNLHRWRN